MGRREIGSSAGATGAGVGAAANGAPTPASTGAGAGAVATIGGATLVAGVGPGTSPPPPGEGRVGADDVAGTARTIGGAANDSGSKGTEGLAAASSMPAAACQLYGQL